LQKLAYREGKRLFHPEIGAKQRNHQFPHPQPLIKGSYKQKNDRIPHYGYPVVPFVSKNPKCHMTSMLYV
jgi:hypothetical protein